MEGPVPECVEQGPGTQGLQRGTPTGSTWNNSTQGPSPQNTPKAHEMGHLQITSHPGHAQASETCPPRPSQGRQRWEHHSPLPAGGPSNGGMRSRWQPPSGVQ